ncbi:hypothetical protein [Haloglycomyces albus]|uniref:hypothetical protein n=1 Tax=Haloglycomyces albus TaxID=526067 RepID=UPI0012EB9111|nr:hypothetical protein [Haloglycomyces albus]
MLAERGTEQSEDSGSGITHITSDGWAFVIYSDRIEVHDLDDERELCLTINRMKRGDLTWHGDAAEMRPGTQTNYFCRILNALPERYLLGPDAAVGANS